MWMELIFMLDMIQDSGWRLFLCGFGVLLCYANIIGPHTYTQSERKNLGAGNYNTVWGYKKTISFLKPLLINNNIPGEFDAWI